LLDREAVQTLQDTLATSADQSTALYGNEQSASLFMTQASGEQDGLLSQSSVEGVMAMETATQHMRVAA
jgi:hypothetical protein